MKLLLVSIHYPPLKSSCAIQMRDLAEQFLSEGHIPTVIVPDENIQTQWRKEELNGVNVYRLYAPKIIDISFLRRAINETLLSFYMIKAFKKTDIDLNSYDGVIWYSPTIFFGAFIYYIKKISKIKSYLILRDIFPEWALDLGLLKKGLVYYAFKTVAHFQYRIADTIGVQTDSNLKYFSKWNYKNSSKKIEVLNNWLATGKKRKSTITINQTKLKDKKIFIYIGNMGIAQDMDIILHLAKLFNNNKKNVGFLFVGRGTELERLKNVAIKMQIKNIMFCEEIDPSELDDLLKQCHVGIVALDPRHKSHNIPGKFLTYMQSGLPVLARINKNTDLEKIINIHNVGKAYSGSDIDKLYEHSTNLIESDSERLKMSRNCLDLSKKMFSSSSATKKILDTFLEEKIVS